MAKRKITVTVDEDLVDLAHRLGEDTLSGMVNTALAAHLDRLARREALQDLLDRWDAEHGPVPEDVKKQARAAFDELENIAQNQEDAS